MLSDQAMFLRTNINVAVLKEYLFKTQALAQTKNAEKITSQLGQTDDHASDKSSKLGSAAYKNRNQNDSALSRSKNGSAGGDGTQPGTRKFDRVLSTKAIQIGHENGITAEFIVKQTADQTVFQLTDLFRLFTILQDSLYANDPEAVEDGGSEAEDKFTYEESILVTILGENYKEFINEETQEWE